MRRIGVDVSFIDIMQSGFERDGARGVQCFGRRTRLVLQLEVGMERGEVQRHVRAQIFKDPVSQLAEFVGAVIQRGDDQIRNFEPDVGFILQPFQGVENRLQMRESDAAVEIFSEGFQVHVCRIHVVVNVMESLARRI